MANILIVEDNKDLRELFSLALKENGFSVCTAADGHQALEELGRYSVDLIVTDIMMPDMDGIELTRCLRNAQYNLPILMITVKDDYQSMKEGFDCGADDYMVKPVNINEMVLRVKALLRRAKINTEKKIVIGATEINCESMTVKDGERVTELPLKEFQLLFKLLSYPNVIFTREQIMDDIWGLESDSDERTLNTHIHRLRDKFETNPDFEIVTIRGLGYKAVKKHE
ncbi:MAG: response regulator transcription factor [Clostridia bacterium]|nr:response regulator transcription factor [Clostridia bacterium]